MLFDIERLPARQHEDVRNIHIRPVFCKSSRRAGPCSIEEGRWLEIFDRKTKKTKHSHVNVMDSETVVCMCFPPLCSRGVLADDHAYAQTGLWANILE
jgi:phage gp16-like protein